MKSNRLVFLIFSFFTFDVLPQPVGFDMKFDTARFDFSVNVQNVKNDKKTYKVSLEIYKHGNVYKYCNQMDNKVFVFSDSIYDVELISEIDTLMYIHYHIRRYGFESSWAKSFTPYTLCSRRKRRLGECIYNYFYSFELFGYSWDAFFSMKRGAIIKLNLSLNSAGKATIISNSPPIFK